MTGSKSDMVPDKDQVTQANRGGGNNTGISNADRAAEAAPGDRVPGENLDQRQDKLLDEALEETFPGSDPISPKVITK